MSEYFLNVIVPSMERKPIGSVVKAPGAIESGFEGVEFTFPFGGEGWNILLEHEEIDELFGAACDTSQPLLQNSRMIHLPDGNLPLFVQPLDVQQHPTTPVVGMDLLVSSMSWVNNSAGRLALLGIGYPNTHRWIKFGYEESPPPTKNIRSVTQVVPIDESRRTIRKVTQVLTIEK